MESVNRKRRGGFIKAKLLSFSKSSHHKPSAMNNVQYSNSKVKSGSQSLFQQHDHYGFNSTYQAPKQKVSINNVTYDNLNNNNNNNNLDKLSKFNRVFGTVPMDEFVDLKASSYISSVQERFKLEGINHAMEMRN
ncbi:hypothetical protein ACFE04_006253 [Oxalis oulophora]